MRRKSRSACSARMSITALLGVALIAAGDVSSASQGRGGRGGGARGGGGHRVHSAPQNRGSVRPSSRGSVRYYQPSNRTPSRSGNRNPGPRPGSHPSSRHHTAHRPPSQPGASNPIQRNRGHGSINNSSKVSRSFTDRRRDAAQTLPRVDRPGVGPGDPNDRVRRRHLRQAARRYRWRDNNYYWYDDGYWYQPYYDGDEQWYEQAYPPAGLGVDELPADAAPVEGEDGLYVANGVYYQLQADGTYAIVDAPDDGMPDPVIIAERSLRFLAQQPAFALTVTDTIDFVQDDGQKIQSETHREIKLRRPDAVAVTADGDDVDRLFWYDGVEMTIVDNIDKVAAKTKVPDTIDAMLDFVVSQLGVNLPLIELLYSDPVGRVASAMGAPEYLGLIDVDGAPCHHLSFSAGDADWQLWVDSGENPTPVMLAISYMNAPETPTYRARFDTWDLAPEFSNETFEASIPDGVEEIPFTTPQSEVDRIEGDLDKFRAANQRVADYIAAQRTIRLFSGIADKPDAQARVDAEKARLDEIGEVSQDEIDAYEERRKELRSELDAARGAAARSGR